MYQSQAGFLRWLSVGRRHARDMGPAHMKEPLDVKQQMMMMMMMMKMMMMMMTDFDDASD